MIIAIEGEVIKKEPTALAIKTAMGLTYEVKVSLNCSSSFDADFISLHTTHSIREDSQTLFGFLDEREKIMFDRVIKINGVGPSTALAICSTFTPESFAQAVLSDDINMIKTVPGIGPKSAKRILVELGDFDFGSEEKSDTIQAMNEATMALESLGFKKESIKKVLKTVDEITTATLIKEALKKLSR